MRAHRWWSALAVAIIGLGLPWAGRADAAAGPAEPVWRWGTTDAAMGTGGILITDWDGDRRPEVLSAGAGLVMALRPAGDYSFEQAWAMSLHPGRQDPDHPGRWGLADLTGDSARELWVLDVDGSLAAYPPLGFAPIVTGRLALAGGERVADAGIPQPPATRELIVLVVTGGARELRAYRLPGLAETWRYRLERANAERLVLAQADGDPGIEVAVSSGSVIDRASSVEQWAYPEMFGPLLAAADLDGDGFEEVVGASSFRLAAYDIDQRRQAWQVNLSSTYRGLAVADVDGRAGLEVVSTYGSDRLGVYDGRSGERLWDLTNNVYGSLHGIGAGDADGDGEADIVWGGRLLSFAPASARKAEFELPAVPGSFSAVALALRGGVPLQLVACGRPGSAAAGDYLILDSQSGQSAADLTLELPPADPNRGDPPLVPLAANVDGDPYDELFLGYGEDLLLLDHDGRQLARHSFSANLTPAWYGDVNGDGRPDLLTRSRDRFNVHDPSSLAYTWQGDPVSPELGGVAVGDVDADGTPEILSYVPGQPLMAHNGRTHALAWQFPEGQSVWGVAVGDVDGRAPLEIAVVERYNRLVYYDGASRAEVHRTQLADDGCGDSCVLGLMLRPLGSDPLPQLLVTSGSSLRLFEHPYDSQPAQLLPMAVPVVQVSDTDGDQHLDLVVGLADGLARYRMTERFPDHVSPVAKALLPLPGTDQVSRDATAEVEFNEAMDPATITGANVQLRHAGQSLPASATYDAGRRVVRITPIGLLPAASEITVWLGPGLTDEAGNGLDGNVDGLPGGDFSFTFTTGTDVDTSGPRLSDLQLAPDPVWVGMTFSLRATADDANPAGSSPVRRVEAFLDQPGVDGSGMTLTPVDGRFDTRHEVVTGVVDTAGWAGPRTLHLHALDGAGNWGPWLSRNVDARPEAAANWPTFGRDAAHTGYLAVQPAVRGYVLAWEADVAGLLGTADDGTQRHALGPAAVANGLVVTNMGNHIPEGGLVGLDAADGQPRWRLPLASKDTVNPATIVNGTVYFQQGNGDIDSYLIALNALTAEELWRTLIGTQPERFYAPTVAEGRVFIDGGSYRDLSAFDQRSGKQLWTTSTPHFDLWSPAYAGGTLYTWVSGLFGASNPRNGESLWGLSYEWSFSGYSMDRTLAVDGERAYFTLQVPDGGDLIAVDLAGRREAWRVPGQFTGTPAVAEGVVYALDGLTLRAIDATDGSPAWSYTARRPLLGAPLVTAGNVHVSDGEESYVLNLASHEPVATLNRGGWLTVANSQLFIAQSNGKLAAYREGDSVPEPTRGPRPTETPTPIVPTPTEPTRAPNTAVPLDHHTYLPMAVQRRR